MIRKILVIKMTTGERIKMLRKEHNLTQEELGAKIGVQKAAIQKYEKGTVKMKISVEREDGEKTEVEKTLVFKAGCSKITFRTALSAFIAMKITVYFSYSLPPPNA